MSDSLYAVGFGAIPCMRVCVMTAELVLVAFPKINLLVGRLVVPPCKAFKASIERKYGWCSG